MVLFSPVEARKVSMLLLSFGSLNYLLFSLPYHTFLCWETFYFLLPVKSLEGRYIKELSGEHLHMFYLGLREESYYKRFGVPVSAAGASGTTDDARQHLYYPAFSSYSHIIGFHSVR